MNSPEHLMMCDEEATAWKLWSALARLAPERLRRQEDGKLMSFAQFRDRFCATVPSSCGRGKVIGLQNVPELRQRLKGFTLREDVFVDLPASNDSEKGR